MVIGKLRRLTVLSSACAVVTPPALLLARLRRSRVLILMRQLRLAILFVVRLRDQRPRLLLRPRRSLILAPEVLPMVPPLRLLGPLPVLG